jgi:hypothetical protein
MEHDQHVEVPLKMPAGNSNSVPLKLLLDLSNGFRYKTVYFFIESFSFF